MFSRFLSLFLVCVTCGSACNRPAPPAAKAFATPSPQTIARPAGVLRVCADPNNLPFSNQRGEGRRALGLGAVVLRRPDRTGQRHATG